MQTVGTFLGIDIGTSALSAATVGQDVTGNNIANSGTPGYSVESVNLAANSPAPYPDSSIAGQPGLLGSGVSAASISRATDQFLNVQVRNATSAQSALTSQSGWLDQVQTAFNEPGNSTINTQLQQFFNNFANLQNSPEDNGVRITAIQGGDSLAHMLQTSQSSLDTAGQQIGQAAANDMATINSFGAQIAQLNVEIRKSTVQGLQPNTLLDQRDQVIDSLSKLTNVSVHLNSDGTANVAIGSTDLVISTDSYTVSQSSLQSRGDLTGGEVYGLSQAQSQLSGYQTQLDNLAGQLIAQVNAQHAKGTGLDGSTGLPFFTGTNARNIAVNPVLIANPQKLAVAGPASTPGNTPRPGDSSNAQAIAALGTATLGAGAGPLSGNTFSGYYTGLITQIGAQDANAKTNLATVTASQTQLTNQRAQETGVNQDNELTNMLKYQRMYQAAAKMISTQDMMLDTLINNMLPAQ